MGRMYQLREDLIRDEEGTAHKVYGIDVVSDGAVAASYTDVFWDREQALAFVNWCNQNDVEPILLPDLVEDAIQEQYMVSP